MTGSEHETSSDEEDRLENGRPCGDHYEKLSKFRKSNNSPIIPGA